MKMKNLLFAIDQSLLEVCQISKIALMQPSFSGWLVTCAYFAHTTFPPCVTIPSSLTLTSIIVPFVITPSEV